MNDVDLERALVTLEVEDTIELMPHPGDLGVHGSEAAFVPFVLVRVAVVEAGQDVELYLRTRTGELWLA